MRLVAFIPARGGSKRIPGKNMRKLAGRPLIDYTIELARSMHEFAEVAVTSDDHATLLHAERAGVTAIDRPAELASDDSPDINWVRHALRFVECDAFAILRPTSPFRTVEMVRRALDRFLELDGNCDSIRAVELARQSPYKMWLAHEKPNPSSATIWLYPLLEQPEGETPLHSRPTQSIRPRVYVQNASLEIAWRSTVERTDTISGTRILPHFTDGDEGFDINDERDWREAEWIAAQPRTFVDRLVAAGGL